MELTVVGCSGSFPGPQSPASCYLLEHEGWRILLDLGNGALGSLQRFTDLYGIDAVLVSHLHVDHFIDLASYYVALKYRPDREATRVAVHGPSDTGHRLSAAYGLRHGSTMAEEFEISDIDRSFEIGPFTVSTELMVHPTEAYGFRVTAGGKSVVYSGDTGPTDRLVDLARGADLALFEASFLDGDNPVDLHLTAREAADHAQRAGVGRLLLTHLVPWNHPDDTREQAAGHFAGPMDLAEVGMRVAL